MHASTSVVIPILLLFALAVAGEVSALDRGPESKFQLPASFASTEAFFDSVDGQVWEKVGTFRVRRVRMTPAGLDCLDYADRYICTHPDAKIVDPGVLCVTYRDRSSSWNFYLPDGVHAVTCKAGGWQGYELVTEEKAEGGGRKAEGATSAGEVESKSKSKSESESFDEGGDEGKSKIKIKGAEEGGESRSKSKSKSFDEVWKAQGKGWGDGGVTVEFPFLRLTDGTVEVQRRIDERPAVAAAWQVSNNVTEFTDPGGRVFWVVVSIDGQKMWLLEVRHVFAAMLSHGPRVTTIPADAPLFLDEREKRMMDGIAQLRAAKLEREALALERDLVRRVAVTFGTGSAEHRMMVKRYPVTHPR